VILPSKHLPPGRDLLSLGGRLLVVLEEPQSVSELWEKLRKDSTSMKAYTTFDWFLLGLCFLYSIGAIEYERGVVERREL